MKTFLLLLVSVFFVACGSEDSGSNNAQSSIVNHAIASHGLQNEGGDESEVIESIDGSVNQANDVQMSDVNSNRINDDTNIQTTAIINVPVVRQSNQVVEESIPVVEDDNPVVEENIPVIEEIIPIVDELGPQEDNPQAAQEPEIIDSFSGYLTATNRARVVFSGHSLTDNSVPTVRDIAAYNNMDFYDIYQAIPGSPIRIRTRGDDPQTDNTWDGYSYGTRGINLLQEFATPTQIPSGDRYDTLVITERHNLLNTIEWESTPSLLRHYHDRLREANSDVRTYFYQSWLSIDKNNPQNWLDYESNSLMAWECVSSKVNLTLVADGFSPNVRTLAAGWALKTLVQSALNGEIPGLEGSQLDRLNAIFQDAVHLTPLGELFVGAYTYSEIFGQSPEGYPIPANLPAETGNALLALAWQLVQEYHSFGNRHSRNMDACRSHIENNVCENYWDGIFNRPEFVAGCQSFYGQEIDGNPFRYDDPVWQDWPAP